MWNEPDIPYWHSTPQDYFRLYDYAVAGVRAALPRAMVGGSATISPRGKNAAAFLEAFLKHCAEDRSLADGKAVPLDFISFHAKGYRRVHVLLRREGWSVNIKRVYRLYHEKGLQLRNKTPKRRVKAQLYDAIQPDAHLFDVPPPSFLVYATDDPIVPVENGRRLHAALEDKGAHAELHIFAHAPHRFALREPDLPVGRWPMLCET